jgi:hypothetical protein
MLVIPLNVEQSQVRDTTLKLQEVTASAKPNLEHFQKYLYGQEFHLRTNHSALTWLMSFRNHEEQTAQWILRLQEYNFTSKHHQD